MRRLALGSWVLYDFANTIFSMNIVTLYFAIWVTVNNGKSELWVGIANTLSALLMVVTMPVLGVFSDAYHRKRLYLSIATAGCCALTVLMGVVGLSGLGPGPRVLAAVACFVLANYGYHAALVFYNALLTSVAEPSRVGRVGGYGVAAGYVGAILGLLIVDPFSSGWIANTLPVRALQGEEQVLREGIPGGEGEFRDGPLESDANYDYELRSGPKSVRASARDVFENGQRAFVVKWTDAPEGASLVRRQAGWGRVGTFIPTGIIFLVFAFPCMVWVREKREGTPSAMSLGDGYRKVWKSLCETRKYPGVLRFLVGKFFYEDSISTVYIFMAIYGAKVLKFTDSTQRLYLMTATTFAIGGSFACGFIVDRIGPKKTLYGVLGGWVIFLTAAAFTINETAYWVIGPGLGVLLGSLWTSSRPLLISLVPKHEQGEFFSLSELTGKTAAVLGPLLFSGIIWAGQKWFRLSEAASYRPALLCLVLQILAGAIIIWKVPDKARND